MKRIKPGNIVFIIAMGALLFLQVPRILNNVSKEGTTLHPEEYQTLNPFQSDQKITFPKDKAIAIFWATWCAPCKLEMARLKSSVEDGEIPEGAIVAINPFESSGIVRDFLKNNAYPFSFIDAPNVTRQLKVSATPTTAFIESGKVTSLSTGLSIIGIWRAESFL